MDYIKVITEEDDYIERAGAVEEITVIITLREYRELIKNDALNNAQLKKLEEENEKLQRRVDELGKLIVAKHPDALGKVFAAICDMAGTNCEEADADETAGGS